MNFRNILVGKPFLYHRTRQNSIISVLKSKSLWSCPTWNFKDTNEYILGLRIIKRALEFVHAQGDSSPYIPEDLALLLRRHELQLRDFLSMVIDRVDHELNNAGDPQTKVYVACVSKDSTSEKMHQEYGNWVIQFNGLLPLMGYLYPWPATTSLLSRVSYDEMEFLGWVLAEGLRFLRDIDTEGAIAMVDALAQAGRLPLLADAATVFLSIFAPNIKGVEYEFEQEWRLKTVFASESMATLYTQNPGAPMLRDAFQQTSRALFTLSPKNRYVQEMCFHNMMIVQNVALYLPGGRPPSAEERRTIEEIEALRNQRVFMGPADRVIADLLEATDPGK